MTNVRTRAVTRSLAAALVAAFALVFVSPAHAASPDVNNDGIVNILDVSRVSSCQGRNPMTTPPCVPADIDEDGDIDSTDLGLVIAGRGAPQPLVEVDVISGTVGRVMLNDVNGAGFVTSARVVPPWVETGGDPAQVRLRVPSVATAETAVELGIEVPSSVPPGIYTRLVMLRTGIECDPALISLRNCLRLRALAHRTLGPRVFRATINVDAPPFDEVPQQPSIPSEDRVVISETGATLARDELLVNLARATENPDEVALRIAAENFGIVVGSTVSKSYQILFQVADLFQLGQIARDIAENNPEVNSVLPHVRYPDSATLAGATPDPSEVDTWSDDVEAAGAWALTVPAAVADERGVDVAVIDCGFKSAHFDLNNNVRSSNASGISGCDPAAHGTTVAGVLSAEWNNAFIAGMAQNHAYLRLVDSKRFAGGPLGTWSIQVKEAMDSAIGGIPPGYTKTSIINVSSDLTKNFSTAQVGAPISPAYCQGYPAGCTTQIGTCKITIKHSMINAGSGKPLLYVFAAGNEARDASLACPAALATDDAVGNQVMTIAAIQPNCPGGPCSLATFQGTSPDGVQRGSNRGPTVTVAAPGKQIRTTSVLGGSDTTATVSGTSFAAPIVSGLAALMVSRNSGLSPTEIKTKIQTLASKDVSGQSFKVINATRSVEEALPLPAKLDLVIGIDLTGSMVEELASIKTQITQVVNELTLRIPDTKLSVVTYQDYPIAFPGTGNACGSNYSAQYGSPAVGAFPYNVDQPLIPVASFDPGVVANLVAVSGSGQDLPESYGRVFWEVAEAARTGQLGFRPASQGALRVLFNFGDDVPHDTNLNETVSPAPIQQGSNKVFDTGVDPGRNGVADCGGDDIDFDCVPGQAGCTISALGALTAGDVHLVHVDSSGNDNFEPYWKTWTARTLGSFTRLTPQGDLPPGKPDLATFMVDQLRLIAAQ